MFKIRRENKYIQQFKSCYVIIGKCHNTEEIPMKNKNNKTIQFIAKAAVIAALYIAIGAIFKAIEFGPIQLRPSEALNMLVYFSPSAAWGLFVGCLINNLWSPFGFVDIIFGSLATLASGLIASRIRNKYFVGIPSILINGFVVAAIIGMMTNTMDLYFIYFLEVSISQIAQRLFIGFAAYYFSLKKILI